MSVKQLKILIYIEMFVIGLFVGYGIYVLHWFSDYYAVQTQSSPPVVITNMTTNNDYTCYTIQTSTGTREVCEKK